MARTPKLGGELPAYNTMGAKPKKTRMAFPNPLASTGSGKTVQRAPRENLGTPGTSKFVQRSPKVNIGTPGSKNFVQRSPKVNIGTPGSKNFVQRTPTNFRAPRKPAK